MRAAQDRRASLALLWVGVVVACGAGCGAAQTKPRSLDARCQGGEAAACLRLGLRLEDGGDDLPDAVSAAKAYAAACQLEELEGCWREGAMLRMGQGVKRDASRARRLFAKACAGQLAMGCLHLAEVERLGEGGAKDLDSAVRRYDRLCRGGLKQACNDLGVAQQARSAATATATFRASCAAGDQLGCANLAVLLVKSGEVPAALPLLQRACHADEAGACVQLAVLYETGRVGDKKDPTRAGMLYQRACKKGHEDGCSGLALLLFLGRGVPAKPLRAMQIWRAVCEAGHGPSCLNLATAYRLGREGVVPIDAKAGAAWAAQACKLGVASACVAAK